MARTKGMERDSEMTQISISIPQDMVGKIDELAAADNRNRSNFIAHTMRLFIAGKLVAVQEEKRGKEE